MANDEHLAILKQGVEAWNKWRLDKFEIRRPFNRRLILDSHFPDLTSANLKGMNLASMNLVRVNLKNTNLRFTNLRNTDLREADLKNVDLTQAELIDANLGGANLSGADFTDVICSATVFADNDLSHTKRLDRIQHLSSSHISNSTLYRSAGNIPESFLRGCGLKDWEIENVKLYQPGLSPGKASEILYKVHELRTNPAIQFNSCFISYSSKDQSFAENLYNQLQAIGVRCWFAPEDIKIGDKFRQRIDEAIRIHDKLLVILSEESISSAWVDDGHWRNCLQPSSGINHLELSKNMCRCQCSCIPI